MRGRWPVSGNRIEGIHFVDYMVESIVSLTHEAFGQRALVVEIMAEGMRNPLGRRHA